MRILSYIKYENKIANLGGEPYSKFSKNRKKKEKSDVLCFIYFYKINEKYSAFNIYGYMINFIQSYDEKISPIIQK